MPNDPTSPQRPDQVSGAPELLERVRTRLTRIQRTLERRAAAADRAGIPRRVSSLTPELRALKVMYHGLARTHREHRKLSGERASPALRAAARGFRQEPNVFSLTRVAGHLDDKGLLKW